MHDTTLFAKKDHRVIIQVKLSGSSNLSIRRLIFHGFSRHKVVYPETTARLFFMCYYCFMDCELLIFLQVTQSLRLLHDDRIFCAEKNSIDKFSIVLPYD